MALSRELREHADEIVAPHAPVNPEGWAELYRKAASGLDERDKEIERLRSNLSMALDLKHKRELELKRLRSWFSENGQRIADELAD